MRALTLTAAVCAAFALSGCLQTDSERALAGGGAGLVAAELSGNDPLTGALLGAAGGALLNDVTGR